MAVAPPFLILALPRCASGASVGESGLLEDAPGRLVLARLTSRRRLSVYS